MLTVIIPAWNREYCLRRCARSVLTQMQPNDELIIVDDFSTDNTRTVANLLANEDSRVRVLMNERKKGAPGARNTGLFSSSPQNDWIAFLDSDDAWKPDFYQNMRKAVIARPDVAIVTCHTELVVETSDEHSEKVGEFIWSAQGNILRSLLEGSCYVDMNGAMIKRDKLVEIGGFDESCPSFQEWDLHIRLAETCTYECVPDKLVTYFQHSGQMSKNQIKTVSGMLYVMNKHRKKWIAHTGKSGWYTQCEKAAKEILRLPAKPKSIWTRAILTDPYFLRAFLFYGINVITSRLSRPRT